MCAQHQQVHTIHLHVFSELQLQHALLVFEFQLSRPERKTNISWVMSALHLAIATVHHQAIWQIESGYKEDWLLPRWEQTVTAVFWGWSLLLWTFWLPCHFDSAQKLCCNPSMPTQAFTVHHCLNLWVSQQRCTLTPPWGQTLQKPMRSSRGQVGSTAQSFQESHCRLEVEKYSVCVWCTSVCYVEKKKKEEDRFVWKFQICCGTWFMRCVWHNIHVSVPKRNWEPSG